MHILEFNVINQQLMKILNIDNIYDAEVIRFITSVIKNNKLLIFISPTINKLYGKKIDKYLQNFDNIFKITEIMTGEINKNLKTIEQMYKVAFNFSLDRKGIIIGIGGGVLLDMVGFVASTFRRKVKYIRVPTTLLAQIDAGVGIKTGINYLDNKNSIGSFYPPLLVINYVGFINSLNLINIQSGLAEILKMAIICSSGLFNKLFFAIDIYYKNFDREQIVKINEISICAILDYLKKDFYENDLKRHLDFGHTFSPFFEEFSRYRINHGMAVALDISLSSEISYIIGLLNEDNRNKIFELFCQLKLPMHSNIFNSNLIWQSLKKIELNRGGKINLLLPSKIGEVVFIEDINKINESIIQMAINNIIVKKGKCLNV